MKNDETPQNHRRTDDDTQRTDVNLMPDGELPRPAWVDAVWSRLEPFLLRAFDDMAVDDPAHLAALAEAIRADPEHALVYRVHNHHLFVSLKGSAAFLAVPWTMIEPEIVGQPS